MNGPTNGAQPKPPERHPIEVEQVRLQAELPDDANVAQTLGVLLGIEDEDEVTQLMMRQLMAADRQVPRFAAEMRNTRRAALGVGFMAGVSFALAAQRVRDGDA